MAQPTRNLGVLEPADLAPPATALEVACDVLGYPRPDRRTTPRRASDTRPTDAELEAALGEAFPGCAVCDGKGGQWCEGRFGEVWEPCECQPIDPAAWESDGRAR
jgi:hypothetical protein